jgi:hypothetical protein
MEIPVNMASWNRSGKTEIPVQTNNMRVAASKESCGPVAGDSRAAELIHWTCFNQEDLTR